jgi:hypothetical protein
MTETGMSATQIAIPMDEIAYSAVEIACSLTGIARKMSVFFGLSNHEQHRPAGLPRLMTARQCVTAATVVWWL